MSRGEIRRKEFKIDRQKEIFLKELRGGGSERRSREGISREHQENRLGEENRRIDQERRLREEIRIGD